MNTLITGVAGFIGSHVAQAMVADGEAVVGLDNFDPFYDRAAKEANLEAVRGAGLGTPISRLAGTEVEAASADQEIGVPGGAVRGAGLGTPISRLAGTEVEAASADQEIGVPGGGAFEFVEADIRDGQAVADVFARYGPFDVVCHLAARAGVRPSIADPLGYEAVNLAGTLNLLEAAIRQDRRPRFVFASSSSVYGNNAKVPFSETDNVDHPISPYAATKKAGELICHTYHHLHGLPVWCLRFFTVYGPRQRPDLAISKFARKILVGEPIEMFGDGTTSRDYTYIDDIVLGVRRAMRRCEGYEVINLGSESPVTLKEMISTVGAACGREPVVEVKPMQPGDVNRTFADVAKAQRLLDYRPSMPFADGVAAQVAWAKARL